MNRISTWFDIFRNSKKIEMNDSINTTNIVINSSDDESDCDFSNKVKENPLLIFPFEIRENLKTESYVPGMTSLLEEYIIKYYIDAKRYNELSSLFNNVYFYSINQNEHNISYNLMVVLSHISYKYLGPWAAIIAMAATRSQFFDVQEAGIRCFENWEDKQAAVFLHNCRFSEKWLQDYADDVYLYLVEEGKNTDVLSKKNIAWEMAFGRSNIEGNIEGYRSRYGSFGV